MSDTLKNNKTKKEIVVTGDFNAKSPLWGCKREDARGILLAEWMMAHQLVVANERDISTFVKGQQQSIVDLTVVSTDMCGKIHGWQVLDEETLSDHPFIFFEVRERGDEATRSDVQYGIGPRWYYRRACDENLRTPIAIKLDKMQTDEASEFV